MTNKNKRDDTLPQADVTQGQKPMISLPPWLVTFAAVDCPENPNAFTNDDIDETLGFGDIVMPNMPERLGNAEEEQQAAWQAAREMGGGGASSPKPAISPAQAQQVQGLLGEDIAAIPEALGVAGSAASAAIPEALGVAGSAAGVAAIPEALGVVGSAVGVGLGVAGAAAAGAGFEAIKTAVTGPAGTRPGSIRDYTPESASGGGGGGIGDAMATQMIMSINKLAGTHSRL